MTVFIPIEDEQRQVMLRSAVEERNVCGVNAAMVVQCLNISWSTLHRSRLFAVGSYDQELSFEHFWGGALHKLSLASLLIECLQTSARASRSWR